MNFLGKGEPPEAGSLPTLDADERTAHDLEVLNSIGDSVGLKMANALSYTAVNGVEREDADNDGFAEQFSLQDCEVDLIIKSDGIVTGLTEEFQGAAYTCSEDVDTHAIVISDPTTPLACADGEVIKYDDDNYVWVCAIDDNTEYTAGFGLTLSNTNEFSMTDPHAIVTSDPSTPLECDEGQVMKFDDTNDVWVCGDDANSGAGAGIIGGRYRRCWSAQWNRHQALDLHIPVLRLKDT